jgi:signal transduction histidine kinase
MGTHMMPGRARWRALRRSIRFTMAAILAIPIIAAAVMWVFAGVTLSRALASHNQTAVHGTVLIRIAVADAVGLVALLVAAAAMAWFARRLSRDASALEASARRFADQQLPQLVERLRRGETFDPAGELSPSTRMKVTEFSRAAAALTNVQRTALTAAATETGLRSGISQVFVSLARRSQSLLQRQLRLLDDLERKAVDPGTLADLFPLDHLTTRMRRHAEGLIILSGAVPGRGWSSPVPVIDVIRGAIAEVEDYKRIAVATTSEDMVTGSAVADMIHLLAELIENATLFAPSGTRVEVKAERVGNGFAFEIEDRGLGIKPEELDAINLRLGSPADFDLANADQLGLFVVGKLAARHSVRVFLRPSPYGGTTAIVLMPSSMITTEGESAATAPATEAEAAAGNDEDLHLALTGRPRRRPAPAGSTSASVPGALPTRRGVFRSQTDTDNFPSMPGTSPILPGIGRGQADTNHGEPDMTSSQPGSSPGPSVTQPGEPAFFASQPTFLSQPVFPDLAGPRQPNAQADRSVFPGPASGGPGRGQPGGPGGPSARPGQQGNSVTAGTHRGLPRRVRQANLSPRLRNSPAAGTATSFHEPEVRSPEQAQSLLASLQRGWQRGREAEAADSKGAADGPDVRDSARGASQEET